MHRVLVVLCLATALSACASESPSMPTPPPPLNLTGTWSGDLAAAGLSAQMTWTLTQTASGVTGPVLIAVQTGTVLLNGVLTGTLAGSTLTYTIAVNPGGIPAQPQCVGQFGGTMTATIGATSTLAGTYAVVSSTCTTPFNGGNLTLTRQ